MLNKGIAINEAMQASYNIAKENAVGIETAVGNLRLGADRQSVVRAFAQGCRDLTAGLIYWSYSSEQYFKPTELNANNAFHFQIKNP
ncbi:hypothetical protein BDW59DRAFT_161261 [Aspergillus cavernicola]|uniref:Uncharacterized protein n=1 Tax=Aspergillus cavernicola TaxID=176166 RepID=A0ABR4IEH0_9EURO